MAETNRVEWFRNARFGMFIHWGLYSVTARDMWYYSNEEIPKEKYEKLFNRFKRASLFRNSWLSV